MTRVMLVLFVLCDVDGDGVDVSVLTKLLVLLVWMVEDKVPVKFLTNFWILA